MILQRISLLNYKNIAEASFDLSAKINCFIGNNGEGKTNLLDAIYFLSFCKSHSNAIDSQVIRHNEDFFLLEGNYLSDTNDEEIISCGLKRGTKKIIRRNKKAYRRLSEHIGLIPLIMVSPSDISLIEGGSEERRRLMDVVISQFDNTYIDTLNRYNKALASRNAMLKADAEPDETLMGLLEEEMAQQGEIIYKKRKTLVEQIEPLFQQVYNIISGEQEKVSLNYISHCQRGNLLNVIQRDRMKDRIMGYSLHGTHRDDLDFLLDNYQMKREGSQGQNKTFVIALKLAQFELLSRGQSTDSTNYGQRRETPILLLDDIFDKLDSHRVEQIVGLVSGDRYGQIFITDTNRDHLDCILKASSNEYRLFMVENGTITLKEERHV